MPPPALGTKATQHQAPMASASILLLSPSNQVLLLHRVRTSSAFPSAHVFPGGNLSAFHERDVPAFDSPARHIDGPAYRLAAIRETFEESGILLARGPGGANTLLSVPERVKEDGRRAVHSNQVRFEEWVAEQGGRPDVDALIPFTRWITPTDGPKRFTTQMYLYMLPIAELESPEANVTESAIARPTSDGGQEIMSATFADAADWLSRAQLGDVILFPPQFYLLTLLSELFREARTGSAVETDIIQRQRRSLHKLLDGTQKEDALEDGQTSVNLQIHWTEKVMSPKPVGFLADGRLVLALNEPGPELKDTARGGDYDRVVVLKFEKGIPRHLEVMKRADAIPRIRGKQDVKAFKM